MKNEKIEKLMEEKRIMKETEFKDVRLARAYAHKLSQKMQEEEMRLMEQKRELDDMIWQLRHAESEVFNYYLTIK